MHIEGLMQLIDKIKQDELRALIALKATVDEKYLHQPGESLQSWLLELWEKIEASKERPGTNRKSYASLNDFFIKIINEDANG